MSAIDADLDAEYGEQRSWEELGHKLFSKEHKEFHTEINQPHAMSVFDASIKLIKDEFGDDFTKDLNEYRSWFRSNMIAYKRKRAEETTRIAAAAAQQQESMKLRDRLLGDLMR